MKTVIEIVKAHLDENGFGGLLQPDAECGCKSDDLVPCAGDFAMCRPAYCHQDPTDPLGWLMSLKKEPPTTYEWEKMEHMMHAEELSSACMDCGGTGMRDSGGIMPWGEAALVPCDCGAENAQIDEKEKA